MKALENDIHVALAILRRHINSLESPLHRLPLDLFPEIASHLSNETDLVNATHVSHRLRNALLSCASLWSHLDLEYAMKAHAFFERSGQTLLYIDMTADPTQTAGLYAELRQQSKRIAALKLGGWSVQRAFLSEPLPSLRRLETSSHYLQYGDWDEAWDTYWTPAQGLTEKATPWSLPSLTSLIIHNLDPIPFCTPHLTRFKYRDQKNTTGADNLLSFLGNCLLLEHIDIESCAKKQDQDGHKLVVSLPNLRTYTQTTFDEACPLAVLNGLSLPSFCSIKLIFHSYDKPTTETHDVPRFENPNYLFGIKRIKLGSTCATVESRVAGTLELINAKGMRVCSERLCYEETLLEDEAENHTCNMAHLDFLRSLDSRSVETLCVDGNASEDRVAAEFLEEALGFTGVKTLVLSRRATRLCLPALDEVSSAGGHGQRFLPIDTLIVYLDPEPGSFCDLILPLLLGIAQKRKAAGFPFKSVSLFLRGDDLGWDQVSEGFRECIEELEVVTGDDVLDWDIDKYFLDGLDHLQKNQDVQWD